MKPTRERMDVIWREMLTWPLAERMAFAIQLGHSAIPDTTDMIDAGMHDRVACEDVYMVVAIGRGAKELKAKARELMAGKSLRPLKVGESATPFSGEMEQFVEQTPAVVATERTATP